MTVLTDLPRRGLAFFSSRVTEEASSLTLLAARCLVIAAVAVDVVSEQQFRTVAARAQEVWSPISVLAVVQMGPPSNVVISLALVTTAVAAIATLAGFLPRVTGLLVASSYTFAVLCLNSLGKIYHDRNVVILAVWILACAPTPSLRRTPISVSSSNGWPIQMIRLSIGLMFLSAAWAKVRLGQGGDWIFGPNLRNVLASEVLIYETPDLRSPPLSSLALVIAEHPLLWKSAALAAVVGEFSLILVFLSRRRLIRRVAMTLGLGTMCGITLLMGMVSFPILAVSAAFLDVTPVHRGRVRRWFNGLAAVYVVLGLVMAIQKASLWPVVPLVVAFVATRFADMRCQQNSVASVETAHERTHDGRVASGISG